MFVPALFWIIVFIASLFILVKGSDYLIDNAEKIGLSFGLSPFIIGVLIVGIGTSLPELTTALVAVSEGVTELIPANAVGSNVANILLVLGLAAVITRRLSVQKNLIYLDLPLLTAATIMFVVIAGQEETLTDGRIGHFITRPESVFLILVYLIYLGYSLFFKDDYISKFKEALQTRPVVTILNYFFLVLGLVGVIIGAKFTVEATIQLSRIFDIGVSIISMFAIALGTSLPELFVSLKAIRLDKPELAVGNIFGSNVFNILMLIGFPGLFGTLIVDEATILIGLPALIIATLVLVISGISNKIHLWDGAMFVMIYLLFVAKLFGIF